MKLNDVRPNVETSGGMEEEFFSIEDQGMIFEILRNKMYSNPILAIAREIASNARDAHREVDKADVPIHICLPSMLEPYYKIKDFGPGISPHRMSNVFIRYTASTKRSDNLQTGGFGLGAKTPFSYSDTFTIVTNVDGVKYNYACYIDETKVGKLTLLSEAPTDEPNGTEIIIPVNDRYDYDNFAKYTRQATQHWDVKPVIKGGSVNYFEYKVITEGDGWKMVHNNSGSYYNRDVKLIIDGIEYPLDSDAAYSLGDRSMLDSSRGLIFLTFDVGELTLAANREQVYLDDNTKDKIATRFAAMKNQVVQSVKDRIAKMPNLWEANLYFKEDIMEAFTGTDFLGNLEWSGYPLSKRFGGTNTGCRVFIYRKGVTRSWKSTADPNKISRSDARGAIAFDKNSVLFVNDLTLLEPTGRHVKKAFDDDPTLKSVQVVCPDSKVSEQDLNDKIHLDMMNPRRLSEITKASGKKRKATARLIVFRFAYANGNFRQVPYSSFEEDKNLKVLCKIRKDEWNANVRTVVSEKFSAASVGELQAAFPDVSFYAVDANTPKDRIEEAMDNTQDLDEFIQANIVDADIDYVKIKAVSNCVSYDVTRMFDIAKAIKSEIDDPNSVMQKFIAAYKMLQYVGNSQATKLRLYERTVTYINIDQTEKYIEDNPFMDIKQFFNEVNTAYPLLSLIDSYRLRKLSNQIAQYVNLVDEHNSKEK